MTTKILEAALAYAARGWSVIPINPRSKLPYVRWIEWQSAVASPERIHSWWQEFPDANVAVIMGEISGMFAVDVDPRKGGDAAPILNVAPTDFVSMTGSNGYHLVYNYPQDEPVHNRVNVTPGIDIRAEGGYIVAPPSVHADTGREYEWVQNGAPGDMPSEYLATIRAPARRNADIDDHWITRLLTEGAEPGERNDAAARLAGYYAGKGLPEDTAQALLDNWNVTKNQPPLAPNELRTTVHSVYKTASRRPENGRSRKGRGAGTEVHFDSGEEAADRAFKLVPFNNYMAEHGHASVTWIVEDWLPAGTVAMMVAPPESFKTWILLDLAISVATGSPFLGQFPVLKSGPVILIQQEDHHGGLAQRLGAIAHGKLGLGITPTEDGFNAVLPPNIPIHVHPDRMLRFDDPAAMAALGEYIAEIKPALVLIDPLYSAADQNNYMADAIQDMWLIKKWRDEYGTAFLLAHHTKKNVDIQSTAREGAWGSQFLNAFLETGWQVRRTDEPTTVVLRRHFKVSESKVETNLKFTINTKAEPYGYKVETVAAPTSDASGVDVVGVLVREGPMSVEELAAHMEAHPTTIRRKVRALEGDGMVSKAPNNKWAAASNPVI